MIVSSLFMDLNGNDFPDLGEDNMHYLVTLYD